LSYRDIVLDNVEDALEAPPPYEPAPKLGTDVPRAEPTEEQRARLAAARAAIVLYGQRRQRRRHTRRKRRARGGRAVAVAAVVVAIGALAASALGIATGVPPVDRLFNGMAGTGSEPGDDIEIRRRITFQTGTTSAPISVPWGRDGSGWRAFSLVSAGGPGEVCLTVTEPKEVRPANSPSGYSECRPFAQTSAKLESFGFARERYSSHRGTALLAGYVAADVVGLELVGPTGRWRVTLGEPWRPPLAGAIPVRLFLASDLADLNRDGFLHVDEEATLVRFDRYEVHLRFRDGRTRRLDGL
jgi:hypothetical protein